MEESYLIILKLLLWTPVKPRFNQLSLFHPLYSAETMKFQIEIKSTKHSQVTMEFTSLTQLI